MDPAAMPGTDLSRGRLRKVASWIRDELDPMVARDGPERLRADDIVSLHELFQVLRTTQALSAMDLRATGIHKAILEVAGTATRWPGRLAEECDHIIAAWTIKFGRLEELRPFLYGRSGRLEGIASAEEFSKTALLNRWQSDCPEKIMSKRSHRHGDLGFEAGDWWINALFAYHAGIIGVESIDGAITFDQHGAYAVVLDDSSEIEASSETHITYRCGLMDRGRYRLTAANFRSRSPIRVLRSHSLNSIWGPKAGVRYEGLYKVISWVVRPAKPQDVSGQHETKLGDLIYEVTFERIDKKPMEYVLKHPTAGELDDYTEYKRLRRVDREDIRRALAPVGHLQFPRRVAPAIAPAPLSASSPPRSSNGSSPSSVKVAPVATPQDYFSGVEKTQLEIPTQELEVTASSISKSAVPSRSDLSTKISYSSPLAGSSTHRGGSGDSRNNDIREIAPWEDHVVERAAIASSITARSGLQDPSLAFGKSSVKSEGSNTHASSNPTSQGSSLKKRGTLNVSLANLKKDGRELMKASSRKHSPLTKLYDGTKDSATYQSEGNSSSMILQRRLRASSSSDLAEQPFIPALEDPFVNPPKPPQSRHPCYSPRSLTSLISSATTAAPISVTPGVSPVMADRPRLSIGAAAEQGSSSLQTTLSGGLRRLAERTAPQLSVGLIVFRNPFDAVEERGLRDHRQSSEDAEQIAPEMSATD